MTLTNFELIKLAKRRIIKLENVIMKDELKNMKRKSKLNIIINLQSSKVGNGTHWVCLIIEKNNAMYFDSFGAIPPIEVIKYCKGLKLGYNSYIVQDMNSTECGNYCLAFLEYNQNSKESLFKAANSFVNMFEHDTTLNDDILDDYMQST